MTEKIIHVTDDTFEQEVLQSDTPVLVDYWAEWCGPCKAVAPVLDQIAEQNATLFTPVPSGAHARFCIARRTERS